MMKDNEVLKLLVGKRFPVESFEEELGKILKKRSSAKLFISNMPDTIKGLDGSYHSVNFKCIPLSRSCKCMFCLMLKHEDGMVLIQKGYLEKL